MRDTTLAPALVSTFLVCTAFLFQSGAGGAEKPTNPPPPSAAHTPDAPATPGMVGFILDQQGGVLVVKGVIPASPTAAPCLPHRNFAERRLRARAPLHLPRSKPAALPTLRTSIPPDYPPSLTGFASAMQPARFPILLYVFARHVRQLDRLI